PGDGTLVNDSTLGYYNSALGTVLDGTHRFFPPPNVDPIILDSPEPNLAAGASILGDWLNSNPLPLNSNWSGLQRIRSSWTPTTETAIIYPIDAGITGLFNLRGNFGVDNGVAVWENGVFKFSAEEPGPATPDEYSNIPLGDLHPGMNFVQVI